MLKLQNLILDALLEAALDQEAENINQTQEEKHLHELEKGLAVAYQTLSILENSFPDDSPIQLKLEIAVLLLKNEFSNRNLTRRENTELRFRDLTSMAIKLIECLKASKDTINSKRLYQLRLNLEELMKGGAICIKTE